MPSDYSILEENLHKLNFIKGIAIYYDKTKTNREVFNKYSNFNAWLEEYAREHSLPFLEFRALIKSIVNEVQNELLDSFEPNKTYSIPENFMKKLNSIKEVGLAGDPYSYHTVLINIFHYMPLENNYSLVCEDGTFLMSKVRMLLPWFYNNVTITEHGVFKCEIRGYGYDRCFPGSVKTSNSVYFWDCNGNYMGVYDFEQSLKILSNCSSEHLTLLSQRKDYNFNIDNGAYFEYCEKYKGKEDVEWEKLLPNGLTFYYTKRTVRGSDYRYYADPHVRDQFGNSARIDEFYLTLEMLQNGKEYLQALISDSTKRQVDALK